MGRIGRGWQLAKMSLRIVRKDKEILLFPFLSAVVTLTILASFFVGMLFAMDFGAGDFEGFSWAFFAFWVAFYLVSFFVAVFFNVAVIGCATIRMNGGDPTVRDGLRIAGENIKYILMWTLFAATIGVILRAILEKAGILGKFVVGALGVAFTIAAYFAVPVFVYEKLGPWKALKRSVSLFKNTWGEAIAGNLGLGIVFFLLALAGLLPIVAGAYLMTFWSVVIGFGIAVIYWIVLALVYSAAQSVLVAALYRYATTGKISEEFEGMNFGNPFT